MTRVFKRLYSSRVVTAFDSTLASITVFIDDDDDDRAGVDEGWINVWHQFPRNDP